MKEFGSFYKSTKNRKYNTWCKYTNRLDTYGCGCQHNCHYCYAKSLLSFRDKFNIKTPSVAKLYKIKHLIMSLPRYEVVRMGGMTDCFQPIEKEQRLTYKTIQLLNYYKISYLIVTKSDLVASDKYIEIYDKDLAHFQISISSTDDSICSKYEGAPVTSKRIQAIEKLYRLGFDVSVRLSPFLYQWCDMKVINNIKCNKILIEFLKVNHWTRKQFDYDYSEHTLKYGGHDNLELKKKIELVNLVTGFEQVSVGELVKDHHHYFMNHVNYNKDDCCNLNKRDCEIYEQSEIIIN